MDQSLTRWPLICLSACAQFGAKKHIMEGSMRKVVERGFIVLALVLLATTMATQVQAGTCTFPSLCIEYSLDGGATINQLVTGSSGSTIADSATLGSFQVTVVSATSNSPGTPSLAELLSATLQIQNTGSSTATLELFIGDVNFTAPTAPPGLLLNSHIGGSVVSTGDYADNSLSFSSCVDPTNGQDTCGTSTPLGLITAGPGTPSINTAASFASDKYASILSLGAPYSISQELTLTLGAGSQMNFSDNSSLTPVPEPASIALLGGIVLLLTNRLSRRKAKQA